MTDFTDLQKIVELEREISMRRFVYTKQVKYGEMTESEARRRIGIMEAIANDYREKTRSVDP